MSHSHTHTVRCKKSTDWHVTQNEFWVVFHGTMNGLKTSSNNTNEINTQKKRNIFMHLPLFGFAMARSTTTTPATPYFCILVSFFSCFFFRFVLFCILTSNVLNMCVKHNAFFSSFSLFNFIYILMKNEKKERKKTAATKMPAKVDSWSHF